MFEPLGMEHSGFAPTPQINSRLAKAVMQTVDGRRSPAPVFELGIAPAAGLYMPVTDAARFVSALFAGGQGRKGPVLEAATLAQMWTPQYPKPNENTGPGIGFGVADLDGHRVVGHSGAVYGFSAVLRAMPDDKLGVVVATSLDVAYAVTQRIAQLALRSMLAARDGKPLPPPETTAPVAPELARQLAGRYRNAARSVELFESAGRLSMCCNDDGKEVRLRTLGDKLVVDDRYDYGSTGPIGLLGQPGDALLIGEERVERVAAAKPEPAPAAWRGLIGEYGQDHNILYIFERHGQLWSLIEWTTFYPLQALADDSFAFPDHGLYPGERLVFTRDGGGRATQVTAAGIVFKRRSLGPEEGAGQLHVTPLRPVSELLQEAKQAQPPQGKGEFVATDLVEVARLDPSIKLDIRYATTNNFLGTPVYT
ncbi:MAG: serine hydrolase, partial [Burkholderiales bacterium]